MTLCGPRYRMDNGLMIEVEVAHHFGIDDLRLRQLGW